MEENKKEQLGIVVDDGSVEVPISNTMGERIGTFRFRPTDFNIIKRYREIAEKFSEVTEPLTAANIDTNGEGADEDSVKIIDEAQKRLFELIDYLFDGNAAEALFGKMNPFSPVGGKFYCEQALGAIGEFISKQFNAEIASVSSRVDKYTHGYKARTGKHRDGRK